MAFAAIMREMSVRLVPVMPNLKIPDETIQFSKVIQDQHSMKMHPFEWKRFYEVSHCFKMYFGYCFDEAEKMGIWKEGMPPDMFYIAAEQVKRMGIGQIMIHAE